MTDYSEKIAQGTMNHIGGATAILFGVLTMAHLQVLTPLVESLTTFLSTTYALGPFSVSYALGISALLVISAKGASSAFGDVKNSGLDLEFTLLIVSTILLATPSVTSWAAGTGIGLVISVISIFLYSQTSRESGLLSGAASRVGEVTG